VSPPVRVAHFVTGNELVEPSAKPGPGQIRDSNSTLVAALIRQFGGEIARQENVADHFDQLLQKARDGEDNFDLMLVSGGASVGDYDFGRKLLRELGLRSILSRSICVPANHWCLRRAKARRRSLCRGIRFHIS